ncbi:hypothetical protein UNSWDHB_1066 [Dehalobacter sp. UNSWDHB]|jgi:Uncharacterized protein conserved in bacteria|uniref:TFIIB-type zinc ribbon-containing protein n=1 Tax=unclassified Dehalobacter TaxID=2635733 RepID=UPI00028B2AD2|nr:MULTISPECIES: zf-TFIIB domain-containing protein [unclassified Dehalobacter]AFV01800.1 hypothetical protein DHBDCA_p771 [Dehalobacter sp. DCA]AFV04836.1 hypothetical protein DCF50_p829 [Dehalobacter sp. CF]EQB21609.1 hypothetical protein UNSWDHB_1066 [Dehalobacter sp. UNSWDHB]
MDCPVCHVNLQMTERKGVEIDYCPQCRGIWLDRGELDKIIEKSQSESSTQERRPGYVNEYGNYEHEDKQHDREHEHEYDRDHYGKNSKHRRGSFLSDLFDFGGD